MKFSIKDFISKCDRICSYLMENFIFCPVYYIIYKRSIRQKLRMRSNTSYGIFIGIHFVFYAYVSKQVFFFPMLFFKASNLVKASSQPNFTKDLKKCISNFSNLGKKNYCKDIIQLNVIML